MVFPTRTLICLYSFEERADLSNYIKKNNLSTRLDNIKKDPSKRSDSITYVNLYLRKRHPYINSCFQFVKVIRYFYLKCLPGIDVHCAMLTIWLNMRKLLSALIVGEDGIKICSLVKSIGRISHLIKNKIWRLWNFRLKTINEYNLINYRVKNESGRELHMNIDISFQFPRILKILGNIAVFPKYILSIGWDSYRKSISVCTEIP